MRYLVTSSADFGTMFGLAEQAGASLVVAGGLKTLETIKQGSEVFAAQCTPEITCALVDLVNSGHITLLGMHHLHTAQAARSRV